MVASAWGSLSGANVLIWIGIALCITQSAIFSGLNLAIFSVSKLRLEVEVAGGNRDASVLLDLRKDLNLTLATVLWGNVTINVLLTLLSDFVLAGVGASSSPRSSSRYSARLFRKPISREMPSEWRRCSRRCCVFTRWELFPMAKPTAIVLNWWLGPEGIAFLRERDFRALITRHAGAAGADVGQLEAYRRPQLSRSR